MGGPVMPLRPFFVQVAIGRADSARGMHGFRAESSGELAEKTSDNRIF